MTQTLASLDPVPSLPAGHAGVLSLTASPRPEATPQRRVLAEATKAALAAPTSDWLASPHLAASLVDLAQRHGLLPAPPEPADASSLAYAAMGRAQQHLETLRGLAGPRQREALRKLAVDAGLLPKPVAKCPRSPLGTDTPSLTRVLGSRVAARRELAPSLLGEVLRGTVAAQVHAFGRRLEDLQLAAPGVAARALLDPNFEANLRTFAAAHDKLVLIPEAGRRLLLASTLDPAGRIDAQARLERQDIEELVNRLELLPGKAASARLGSSAPTEAPVVSFNAYGVVDCDHARALYSLQEREGVRGLYETLSLNFVDGRRRGRAPNARDAVVRDEDAKHLRRLFATYGVLPRLMAKGVPAIGARRSYFGHHPVELFVDTPAARARFAAEDAAAAKQTMLRLNLDAAGHRRVEDTRPMLGFAERV